MQVLTSPPASRHPQVAEPRFNKVRILADDLTGACDSAAAFVPSGNAVRVWLGAIATHPSSEPIQAFNTASRAMDLESAADAVAKAAVLIPTDAQTLWFKKVDSAGRGAIPAEVLAAHRALTTRAILFAPSFPAAGRTVRDGVLHVADTAGTTNRTALFPQFEEFASTVQLSRFDQVSHALESSTTVLVCDASTQEELEALATINEPGILFVGSAGLAKALATVHFPAKPTRVEPKPRAARATTISGSQHRVTELQMSHLTDSMPDHTAWQIPAMPGDEPAILAHFANPTPDALILTGGDTALFVLQTLGAHSILLRGEMSDGIPWGIIQGGLAHDRIVVTKSGGFGSTDTLTRIVQEITGEISE